MRCCPAGISSRHSWHLLRPVLASSTWSGGEGGGGGGGGGAGVDGAGGDGGAGGTITAESSTDARHSCHHHIGARRCVMRYARPSASGPYVSAALSCSLDARTACMSRSRNSRGTPLRVATASPKLPCTPESWINTHLAMLARDCARCRAMSCDGTRARDRVCLVRVGCVSKKYRVHAPRCGRKSSDHPLSAARPRSATC
jgi:hypothetical protein